MTDIRTVLVGAASGLLVVVVGLTAWKYFQGDAVSVEPAIAAPSAQAQDEAVEFAPPVGSPSPATNQRLASVAFPPSPEAMQADEARIAQQASAAMEAKWSADRADPVQALETEKGLVETAGAERVLQARDQPARLVDIKCRSTMCRIESEFARGSNGNEWATRLLMESQGRFSGSTLVVLPGSEKGKSKVVVYAFKRSR